MCVRTNFWVCFFCFLIAYKYCFACFHLCSFALFSAGMANKDRWWWWWRWWMRAGGFELVRRSREGRPHGLREQRHVGHHCVVRLLWMTTRSSLVDPRGTLLHVRAETKSRRTTRLTPTSFSCRRSRVSRVPDHFHSAHSPQGTTAHALDSVDINYFKVAVQLYTA